MNCDKCGKDMVLEEFVEKAGLCTECYLENGRTKGDVTRDERALTIPDIYLAEFVGVLRRALNKGGMTDRLDDILDSWCDAQERYLEEKYPTEHKQGACPISLHFVTKPCEPVVFPGLSELITTGYYSPVDTAEKAESIVERLLNASVDKQRARLYRGQWREEPTVTTVDDETMEQLLKQAGIPVAPIHVDTRAFREGLERFAEQAAEAKRTYPVLYPSVRHDKDGIATRLTVLGIDGSGAIAIEPEEPRLESLEWGDNRAPVEPLKVMINPTLEELQAPICSCRQFKADNLECPQHGRGTAWHDLHRGE